MTLHSPSIPLWLLTDRAELLKRSELQTDIFCDEYDSTELSRVRIERREKRKRQKNNSSSEKAGVLYYDCVRSLPKGVCFEPEMKIKLGERLYVITEVERLCGADNHHIKVSFR